jgi:hypothetical protein
MADVREMLRDLSGETGCSADTVITVLEMDCDGCKLDFNEATFHIHLSHSKGKGEFKMKRIEQERPNQLRPIPINLQEEVRRRAYELYQERGNKEGSELEDWLRAEAEVLDHQRTQRVA